MNGAFRPKGGNEVHGLFDDVGGFGAQQLCSCSRKLKLQCKIPAMNPSAPAGHLPCQGRLLRVYAKSSPNWGPRRSPALAGSMGRGGERE